MVFNNSARFYIETNQKVSLVPVRILPFLVVTVGHMPPSWASVSSSAKNEGVDFKTSNPKIL